MVGVLSSESRPDFRLPNIFFMIQRSRIETAELTSQNLRQKNRQTARAVPAIQALRNAPNKTRSAWDFLQHLGVRWKLFHEHQQALDRFLRLVAGEAAADQIDFLQFPRL